MLARIEEGREEIYLGKKSRKHLLGGGKRGEIEGNGVGGRGARGRGEGC